MSNSDEQEKGHFLVYEGGDGTFKIDVRLAGESVWLSQSDMAKLFQCSKDNISLHLKKYMKKES